MARKLLYINRGTLKLKNGETVREYTLTEAGRDNLVTQDVLKRSYQRISQRISEKDTHNRELLLFLGGFFRVQIKNEFLAFLRYKYKGKSFRLSGLELSEPLRFFYYQLGLFKDIQTDESLEKKGAGWYRVRDEDEQ